MPKLRYYKRHRMELDLRHPRPPAELPPGFNWVPWSPDLLELHARAKWACFTGETDAEVFPCLGTLVGCRELMTAIAMRPGFCPGATWLVACAPGRRTLTSGNPGGAPSAPDGCVGTVQGLRDSCGHGGVQNLGVAPGYRGLGIGRALLLKALDGFAAAGARRAFLEVTASNATAVRMYRRLGFRSYKVIYRGVEAPRPAHAHDAVGAGI